MLRRNEAMLLLELGCPEANLSKDTASCGVSVRVTLVRIYKSFDTCLPWCWSAANDRMGS